MALSLFIACDGPSTIGWPFGRCQLCDVPRTHVSNVDVGTQYIFIILLAWWLAFVKQGRSSVIRQGLVETRIMVPVCETL